MSTLSVALNELAVFFTTCLNPPVFRTFQNTRLILVIPLFRYFVGHYGVNVDWL